MSSSLIALSFKNAAVAPFLPPPLPLPPLSLLAALSALSAAALAGYLLSLFVAYEYRCRVPAIPGCSAPPRPNSYLSRYFGADTLESLRSPDALRERRHAELGDVYSSIFLGNELISVRGFKNIRFLLNAEHEAAEVAWPDAVQKLLGPRSVSTTYFDAHRVLRRTMAPALGPRAVSGMIPTFAETMERHLRKWSEESSFGEDEGEKGAGKPSKTISGVLACKSLTFEIALDVILGFDPAKLTPELYREAHDSFHEWLGGFAPGASALLPRGKLRVALAARDKLLSLIDEFLTPMLAHRREERRKKEGGGSSKGEQRQAKATVMALLVDAALVDEEERQASSPSSSPSALSLDHAALLDVGLNLLFAGHDTSATTLCLLLRELATPRGAGVLRRLREEQALVVAKFGDQVTSASLAAAPLAAACVKEMLRLRPIVPQLFKKALRDIALDAGCDEGDEREDTGRKKKIAVRAGSTLVLDVANTLLEDERWAKEQSSSRFHPSRFEPDRWLVASSSSSSSSSMAGAAGNNASASATGTAAADEDAAANNSSSSSLKRAGAHVPFGGGARMCAGYVLATAELETALALLSRSYEWRVLRPDAPLRSSPLPLPSDGLVMSVRRLVPQKNKEE